MITYADFLRSRGYEDAMVINTSLNTTLSPPSDAIFVGGAGNVVASLVSGTGTNITFTCIAGQILPIRAKTITSASNATGIVALWSTPIGT